MFIPLFLAILLGLVNPSTTNSNCTPNSGTVVNTQNSTDDEGDNGDEDDDTGGQTSQTPPPKP